MDADQSYNLPKVSFQSDGLRRRIILSYWIVLLLGLPLWWVTTSIERLSLPVDRVQASTRSSELQFPLDILIEHASGEPSTSYASVSELARQVRTSLEALKRQDPVAWKGLDVNIMAASGAQPSESAYRVVLHSSSEDEDLFLWIGNRELHVRASPTKSSASSFRSTLASALVELLIPRLISQHGRYLQEHIVARYAPKYRLAFSLLNEDASAGDAVHGWDINSGIREYISPVLAQLEVLHNFTIESQIQFHAPLTFDPPPFESFLNDGVEEPHYFLGKEELKMFINSADWTLASSVSEDPVLHFILFVPSVSHRPLKVQKATGAISTSFVVPQWGGVAILNLPSLANETKGLQHNAAHLSTSDLAQPFRTFRSQLLTLLGVPPLPPSVSFQPQTKSQRLSDWQIDSLLRQRAFENTRDSKEVLSSIVKLVDQIENMPVGQDVKGDVQGALDAIAEVYAGARESPLETLKHSARANTLSSRAFFNPGMLALLYFPAEHKYAVYIPLFAPVSVPLLAAAIRELKRWRTSQRERQKVE